MKDNRDERHWLNEVKCHHSGTQGLPRNPPKLRLHD
jgi:hypothetical protein